MRSPGLYGTLATTNNPGNYISSLAYLLAGCVILGFGVYTEVLANVAMLPGESFVRAVSSTWKTEFGSTKGFLFWSPSFFQRSSRLPGRMPGKLRWKKALRQNGLLL